MVQLIPLPSENSVIFCLFKSRLVLFFWYWLTQVVLEKRPLNGYSSSSSVVDRGRDPPTTTGTLGGGLDLPVVDTLSIHNVVHQGATEIWPFAGITAATCFRYH